MNKDLVHKINNCQICKKKLPQSPKPIFSISPHAKILVVGQAPGIKAHNSGSPWDDASGRRLRQWMDVSSKDFYDVNQFAIMSMGLCYPGRGAHGDLGPRAECAPAWMEKVLAYVNPKLILLIGRHSQKYFLGKKCEKNLTETVLAWENFSPQYFVLPHPSPRNNIWLKKHPWFEKKIIPALAKTVRQALKA